MRRLLTGACVLLALALAPAAAPAEFGIVPGSFHSESVDAADQPDLRAGAHPDRLVTSFAFNADANGGADGNAKDIVVQMPTGFTGNARGLPACPRDAFGLTGCPPETQIGQIDATFVGIGMFRLPIYNIAPQEGEAAEFGFVAFIAPIRMIATVDAADAYATTIALHDLSQSVPLAGGTITLWGIPADHVPGGSTTPRRALLTNPTRCDRVPTTTLRARSWQQPDTWVSAQVQASGQLTGCGALPFHPSVGLSLDTPAPDAPSGLRVAVSLQQNESPDGLGSSQLRDLSIQLPPGVTLSPAVATGLSACSDAQLGVGSAGPPSCPPSSKIGSAALDSPLTGPLPGALYLGQQLPGDPYRLFMTADGPGFVIKLRGSLQADPDTGQLTASFNLLPELTFDALELHFKDGPRAPLATPAACGVATGSASLTPYSTATPVTLPVSVTVGGGSCPPTLPFAPQLVAGATPASSGDSSAFTMTVSRQDGDQPLGRLALTLPPGLTARLADVTPCPAAQASSGSCPAASRIGSLTAEVGAGSSPLPLSGDAYLIGPYRHAPFGVALVIHAQAGPLDLGTLAVLGTLRLDPLDGRLTIATPLPRMLAGIPLRLQTIALDVDRPGFMLNPTRCAPTQLDAAIGSADAAVMRRSVRFAVGGCRRLPFRPRVVLSLGPPAQLRAGGGPSLRIDLRTPAGQANLRSAAIRLPRALRLNETAVTAICSRVQAREGRCPAESQVGTAVARTPLLAAQLRGPVSVVAPAGGGQPDLWASLAGSGIRLSLRSTLATPTGKPMLSRFVELPDLPLTRFALTLRGGSHAVFVAGDGFCRGERPRRLTADAALRAQNGAERALRAPIRARPDCAP